MGDEEVDLVGEGCGIGGRGAEEADEGAIVAGGGPVVEVVVRPYGKGGEFGIGLPEARLCTIP